MIAAVVLAAGRGERMGAPKAAIEVSGRTFLESILRTLEAAGIGTVRVVLAPPGAAGARGEPERWVVNPDPDRGMLSSLRCGLRALPENVQAVLVWPVDHPRVSAATVRALAGAWRLGRPPVVVPSHGGRRGHPVLFDAGLIGELLAAPDRDGARAVVRAHEDRVELPVDDGAILDDIDTPADLARAFPRRG